MSDNAEEGIARMQAAAVKARGTQGSKLREHQTRTVGYLDDRIFTFIIAISFLSLIVLWATASSSLVLYGSFAAVILLTILWGLSRLKRIDRTRQERERQANNWQSGNPD